MEEAEAEEEVVEEAEEAEDVEEGGREFETFVDCFTLAAYTVANAPLPMTDNKS